MADKAIVPINDLVDEVIASVGQLVAARQDYQSDCLTVFHLLGHNICGHPAYKKGKHGQGKFFEMLAEAVNTKQGKQLVSPDYLGRAAQLYTEYPELRTIVRTLEEEGKTPTISNARFLLSGERESKSKEEKCKHCLLHCK